jgi:hypothetical protein
MFEFKQVLTCYAKIKSSYPVTADSNHRFLSGRYFTLDKNQKPVGGNFAGVKGEEDKEEKWGVKDYI